jgi:hypothetical protein
MRDEMMLQPKHVKASNWRGLPSSEVPALAFRVTLHNLNAAPTAAVVGKDCQ